jgi:hypothetical protein
MKTWNKADMWMTEAFDCSGKPVRMLWMWSAMLFDASKDKGWHGTPANDEETNPDDGVPPMWWRAPNNNQLRSLMWETLSTNSLALKSIQSFIR